MHDSLIPLLRASVALRAAETAWVWEPAILAPLAILGALYGIGVARLWASGVGRGVSRSQAAAFGAGWVTLVLALLSPLHGISEQLFSAHMVQHELLMTVAAPLLVVGRPVAPVLWAFPHRLRRSVPKVLRAMHVRPVWRGLTRPFNAWLLQALAIWIWHLPRLFQATLTSDTVHAVQHLCFLGSAALFWWSLLEAPCSSRGLGVLYLFTTAVHTSILGALMTFSRALWYPAYAGRGGPWGVSPLQDQALAGLIMWIPGSLAYLIGALSIAAAWLRESEWRVTERERASLASP